MLGIVGKSKLFLNYEFYHERLEICAPLNLIPARTLLWTEGVALELWVFAPFWRLLHQMGKLGCVASTAWLRSRRHSPGTHLGVYELRSFERSIPVFRLGVTAADNSRNSFFLGTVYWPFDCWLDSYLHLKISSLLRRSPAAISDLPHLEGIGYLLLYGGVGFRGLAGCVIP